MDIYNRYNHSTVVFNTLNANLYNANLSNADLRNANLNWQSHDLLSEVLRQNATTTRHYMLAGYIIMRRDLCWHNFFADENLTMADKKWVISVFKQYETEDNLLPHRETNV